MQKGAPQGFSAKRLEIKSIGKSPSKVHANEFAEPSKIHATVAVLEVILHELSLCTHVLIENKQAASDEVNKFMKT